MEEEAQRLVPKSVSALEMGYKIRDTTTKLELTVDEVIEEYVGSLGFSQMLHVFLVSLAWIFDSQNTLVTIFTDAQPSAWHCTSPPCMKDGISVGGGNAAAVCGMVAGGWEWIGGNNGSVIAEWNLVCDRRFLAAAPASLGRKKTVVLSCVLASITAFLTSLSPNIWVYTLLRFSNGFARSGIGICCLVLSTEAVGRKWRGQVGQYGFFFFTAGFFSLPLIAYPNRTCWRNIYKILSIPPLFYSLLIIPYVSESPRWLLVKGRSKEALEILKRYAQLNGRKLPANLSLLEPSQGNTGCGEAKMHLWSTKWAAKRMIILMIAGFGVGSVYYGVQLNVENLNFNLYYSVALNAMMEIPAVFVGSVLLSCTNRRLLFSWSAYIAGISSLICILFSRGGHKNGEEAKGSWAQLSIEGVGFMAASTAFDVSYIYCVELFPTNVRNFAVSMLRQSLMLGASVAPLFVVLGRLSPSLSFLVFGILSIFSGLLSIWLPETENAPLYETLEQQEEEEKLNSLSVDRVGNRTWGVNRESVNLMLTWLFVLCFLL